MEQFNLDTWLKDKSRKICTRDGRPVRIICTDRKANSGNIVGLIGEDESLIYVWNSNGIHIVSCLEENDIFFADKEEKTIDDTEMNSLAYLTELGYTCIPPKKEEKLTEFEKELINLVFKYKYWDSSKDNVKQGIKKDSKLLLDLSRKEIRKEQQEKLGTPEMPIDVTEPYYIKGKQDALESLPKWKKAKKDEELDCHVAIQQDDRVVLSDFVQKDEYYITLDVLKTLPKEE